jgi:hypothetical protein
MTECPYKAHHGEQKVCGYCKVVIARLIECQDCRLAQCFALNAKCNECAHKRMSDLCSRHETWKDNGGGLWFYAQEVVNHLNHCLSLPEVS